MADFVAVLRKTIGALGENTPEMREMVYERARATIEAKLAAIDPPPPAAVADRQRRALEDAIAVLRAEFDDAPEAEADDDLENLFASLSADPVQDPAPLASNAEPMPAYVPPPAMPQATAPTAFDEPAKPSRRAIDPVAELEAAPANEHASQRRHEAIAAAGAAAAAAGRKSGPKARGRAAGLVATLAVLAVLGAGGYAIWINKDDFSRMIGLAPAGSGPEASEEVAAAPVEPADAGAPEEPAREEEAAATPAAEQPVDEQAAQEQPAPESTPAEPEQEVAAAPAQEEPRAAPTVAEAEKFTQRLLPDGREIDEGPAGGERSVGEGTSVAAAVQPPTGEAQTAMDAPPAAAVAEAQETAAAESESATPAVAVGQRAIFYEERTSSAQGSAESGSIVWSVVQESPGGDLPPEPAIRAEAIIPGKDVQLRMTIRRNGDQTLPAAHIVEMIFLTPDNFEGGSISNVSRISFKETEQATGNPLIGIPAKIADGFFLIALGDSPAEIETNTTLLRRQSWLDIPIVYQSGRRALLSMEKGIPGDRIFQEVLRAWSQAGSG